MDNQQDQFGTPNAANTGRTSQQSTPSAASTGTSRKPAAAPLSAESKAVIPNAEAENTANAGANRQGEGQQTNAQEGTLLDSALNSGKQWIEDSGVLNSVNQLPQSIKDLGNRALDKVNGLSTTQKVVGGAILAAGIGWLATRKGKSSSSSESSPYNYGRQRDAGSYGRRSYGYQAPDASTSRRPEAGSGRSDSGAPYGSGGSRYGSNSYGSDTKSSTNTGIKSGSGRSDSSYGGASASTDHGAQKSSGTGFSSKDDGFRSVE
jgi:hypothetical protein